MTSPERQEQLSAAYKECFATPAGQIVLADLKAVTTLNRPARFANYGQLVYDEAQRALVLYVINRIERKPGDVPPAQTINEPKE